MKVKKGKILLEIIYNIFLWSIFYMTSINATDEQYAKNLFLCYIPIIYQEGFIIFAILEEEKKGNKKSSWVYYINVIFTTIIALRFIQAICYMIVEKNNNILYTFGIVKFGWLFSKENILLLILCCTIVVTLTNCCEAE